jgi:protein tyrosine/serine phosphatase
MVKIKITITEDDKMKGYYIKGNKITFIFDKRLYQNKQLNDIKIKEVSLNASFTAWKNIWKLEQITDELWILDKKISEVDIPGNSGQGEFRFVVNDQYYLDAVEELSFEDKFYDSHSGGYKHIIHLDESTTNKIKEINSQIKEYKTNYSSDEELANFRSVNLGSLGEDILYRSYHPLKESRADHPLEEKRLMAAQELISNNKINSIINLSDTDEHIFNKFPYYNDLILNNNTIFTNKGHNYDVFYYIADSDEFANLVKKVANFILDDSNKAPFLVHCRIGTDRTGVIVAILAALMDASWEEVVKDYQESNKMGIGEYRDERLLEYAFVAMLGSEFKDNLTKLIEDYFKSRLGLKEIELKKLKDKLTGKL